MVLWGCLHLPWDYIHYKSIHIHQDKVSVERTSGLYNLATIKMVEISVKRLMPHFRYPSLQQLFKTAITVSSVGRGSDS